MGKSFNDRRRREAKNHNHSDLDHFSDKIPNQKKKEQRSNRRNDERYVKNFIKNGGHLQTEDYED